MALEDSEIVPDPVQLLTSIGRALSGKIGDYLQPTDLSARGTEVMVALRNGPVSQNSLADVLRVHPVKLVTILNDLERAELIQRRRDPGDRRRHTVSISELGRARLAAVDIVHEKLDSTLFANMTAADKTTLATLLTQIAKNLSIPPKP